MNGGWWSSGVNAVVPAGAIPAGYTTIAVEFKTVTEPVHFFQCEACARWRVAFNEHARRFCDNNCRSRFTMRAMRARRKAAAS